MDLIALGLIETVGYTTAVFAADAAVKAANVEIVGMEKVIGVKGFVGVTIHLTGDVAAVSAAVDAGREQAESIGEVISTEVIPRLHSDVHTKLVSKFLLKPESQPNKKVPVKKTKKEKGKAADTKEDNTSDMKQPAAKKTKKNENEKEL
ncbi:BMC domain-containing protein [Virgibacillus flavescens]|uniref:BMC domain-containing protein n=1 Tax=Virgibacillus flavescens TaxID=1611422 RepID=UPI003D35019F